MRKPISTELTYLPTGTGTSQKRIEEVARKHRILERATESGRKNEPRSDDIHLDETQRELVDESTSFIATVTRLAAEDITKRTNEVRMLSPAPLDTPLERATIKREVAEVKDRFGEDYVVAHGRRQAALRDLRSFEESNRLGHSSAVYGNDFLMFFSFFLFLVLAEAAFNAFLFAELQTRGLVGGLMLAGAVGSANVLMGVGTGFIGWRMIIHVKPLYRALGIVTTVLLMTSALALHLALGDLREAITHSAGAQIDFLVITKPWRWFAYTSIAPFVLFAVGVGTYLIAALKGRGGTWGIVAPYWGHEGYDRRFKKADAILQDANQNLKDAVQNAFDGERAKLRVRLADETSRLAEIRRSAAEAHGIARTLGDSIQHEIGRQEIWQRMYRDRNRLVRDTQEPAYFDVFPAFEEWRAARLDLSELTELVAAAERTLSDNTAKLAALEEETLREQVTTINGMLRVVAEGKRRSKRRAAEDDGFAGQAAE